MDRHLHIVSYAVPYPPDYGGIIDVFYRIKSLSQLGIKIHLHCYEYRGYRSKELEDLCYSVQYYPRKIGLFYQFSLLPYVIRTRQNKDLLANLMDFDAPVLFDGLHTSYGIDSSGLKNRRKVIRAHNIEHAYYVILGKGEKNLWKKIYFYVEAFRLEKYEKIMRFTDKVACVSLKEHEYFSKKYNNSVFIPSSHHFFEIESLEGSGDFALFHGNLMINENSQVAEWLIKNVAPSLKFPLYIAGKNPPESLLKLCANSSNCKIVANPDDKTMHSLIRNAHIHLLPVFESCGLRLKLLYALYAGRHCIVNKAMTDGTTLTPLCEAANSADEMIETANRLFLIPFTKEQSLTRKAYLEENYSNISNAKKMIALLFD